MSREDLNGRIESIETGYEFLLAFAAQGVRDDRDSTTGGQLRVMLDQMTTAIDGLADAVDAAVADQELQPVDAFRAYGDVLRRDAEASLAAVRLVATRESISSQMVDNLNASIHLRALLTDLFLMDDLLG